MLKRIVRKWMPLILAFSLTVGAAADYVPAGGWADGQVEETAAEQAEQVDINGEEQPEAENQQDEQPAEPEKHAGGQTTVGELKEFMDNNFPDDAFRSATLSAVLKYYGLLDDADDNGVIKNTKKDKNKGPDDFASEEEVLGWVGRPCEINVKNPNNLEGIQYISRLAYKATKRPSSVALVNVTDTPAINMQRFWGTSNNIANNPDAVITAGVNVDRNTVTWPQSNNGKIINDAISLPGFVGSLYTGDDWYSFVDSLQYLRSGELNKTIEVNSELVRDNGENTISIGELRWLPQNISLLQTKETSWVFGLDGKSLDAEEANQYYDLWEYYYSGDKNPRRFSPSFSYQITAKYYSSANIDVDHQLYGGFTFRKISENNKQLNLSGAQYVVKKGEKYLSAVGAQDTEAAFTDDIAQAKVFETNETGTFTVAPIPEGTYEVVEVKAPAGYKLNPTPVSVKVTVDDTGIANSYLGAEGSQLTVNANEITLTPNWKDGNGNEMSVSGGTTTKQADLFLRNGSEGGKPVTQMKHELLQGAENRYTTLQEPEFTVKNLEGKVPEGGRLTGLSALKSYINDDLIGKDAMQEEWDSYTISSDKDIIYYDTTSVTNCVATQMDAPLPISLKFNASKILTGGDALTGGEFEFTLVPAAGNPADDPFKGGKTVTNGAGGTIDLGEVEFTKPGTYQYVLKETDGGTLGKQDDITYDTAERTIKVEVTESGTDGLTVTVSITANGVTEDKVYTSAAANKVSYVHLVGEKLQNAQISQTVEALLAKIDVAKFVNSKKTVTLPGNLTVSKTVSGAGASTTKEFTFTVTLSDTTLSGAHGDMTFQNGVATFKLKDGESQTAIGIPAGVTYTVKESDNAGYTVTVNNTNNTSAEGTIIAGGTATAAFNNDRPKDPDPVKVTLTAAKTLDGQAPTGSSYSFVLKDETGKTVEIKSNKDGDVTFLPLSFSAAGTYIYYMTEQAGTDANINYDTASYKVTITVTRNGDKYQAAVSYEKDGQAYNGTPAFANTTKTPPPDNTISVTVSKVWDDGNNANRPTSVTVQLYKNGAAFGNTVTLNAGNGWTHKWTGLDKTATWTVDEVNVPDGYKKDVTHNGNEWTVTNKQDKPVNPPDDTISVTVSKVWNDGNNANRPTSVTVQLYKNGAAFGNTVTLNAGNGWTHKWTGLDKNATWTVDEVNVPDGYKKDVTHNGNEWTVTNKLDTPDNPPDNKPNDPPKDNPSNPSDDKPNTPDKPNNPPKENPGKLDNTPKTGDTTAMGLYGAVMAVSAVACAVLWIIRKKYRGND